MSAQQGEAMYVMRPQRIRHENSQSIGGISGGMKDLLVTGAALGVGAISGYFILDYIFKSNVFGNGSSSIVAAAEDMPAEVDVNTDTQADIAHTLPYDRTTRINSYGNTGISAYRGQKSLPRLTPASLLEIGADTDWMDPGFNQVFTDDAVYEVV